MGSFTNPAAVVNRTRRFCRHAAALQLQDGKSNAIMGTMTNLGNGNYSFQLIPVASAPASVNAVSNLGGKTGQGVAIVP